MVHASRNGFILILLSSIIIVLSVSNSIHSKAKCEINCALSKLLKSSYYSDQNSGHEKSYLRLRGGNIADTLPELKPPPALFNAAVATGEKKASLSPLKTLILGIVSGCHIAFGAYLLLSVGGNCPGLAASNPGLQKILMGAFGLPFGLAMTIFGGGELFTGNTAMLTTAFLEKKVRKSSVAKNWIISYAGNFIGSLLMAWLVFSSGTLGNSPTVANISVAKTSISFLPAFIRGLLCNWLVCMAVYMANGASSLPGKMTG
jgi:formate/nitrite transporter FocA (FNT family)